jgi:cytoskeleton protein RodZ
MDDPARTDSGESRREGGSAGALLRAAREGQGMHIATLAAAIKVAPRKLDALEHDRWDELPGPTFTRALAQAVCRALKADPQPVMDLLPPADTSMLDSTFGSINEPFAGPGGREPGLRGWIPRGPWLIAAIALLLGAALVLWLPSGFLGRLLAASAPAGETSVAIGPPSGSGAGTIASPTTTLSSPAAPVAVGSQAPQPSANPAAAEVPASPARTDGSPSGPATAVPAGDLVIQCSARSWIEVVDARGRVLMSRNLEAGESLGLDGLAPMQLVIGNVSATRVSYKGKPVELESRGRDNVARFELR